MYSIILKDGKTINIEADTVYWDSKDKMVKLYHHDALIARINIKNIVGWVKTDHKVESEE